MTPAWSLLPDEWKPALVARGLRAFRADQILQALYRDWITDWDAATTLPRDLRETMKTEFPLRVPEVLAQDAAADGTVKLLLGLHDGQTVETVVIPAKGRFTQCVSTQVGCAMGCAFCASGSRGLVRSLEADEVVAQVMAAQRLFATPENRRQGSGLCLTNLVVMGMGEPFANYDATLRALKVLNAGKGPNLGARHITLSTCGVVPGFARLAAEGLQFELSVSLHAPNDALRSRLMPVNRRWPIDDLLAACRDYTAATGRVITFEYTLVAGVNDSRDCAQELVRRLKTLPSCKVNLIPLSPVEHRPEFRTPDEATQLAFLDVLMKARIQTMLRRSRGKDVAAACGQLRLREFLARGGAALGAALFPAPFICRGADAPRGGASYSISILGDTHFDAAPVETYHGRWVPRDRQDWKDRQGEFKRNLEMWTAGRVPSLLAAAARTRRPDTVCRFHMGDLIQGDCTDPDVYRRFFRDAHAVCTQGYGDLPFLTVCGNHDIRGGGENSFDAYALPQYARAVGRPVSSANFLYRHGPDAYIFVDFMRPDPALTDSHLAASAGARHTFICTHGPIAPSDTWGPYWFLFGEPQYTEHRRAFFARLLKRRAIVLCGHLHKNQIRRWVRPEGALTEFCANSVWRKGVGAPRALYDGPDRFGEYVRKHPPRLNEDYDGRKQTRTAAELVALADEYRPGLVQYRMEAAAGHYMLRVSDDAVDMDFYACDATAPTATYRLANPRA